MTLTSLELSAHQRKTNDGSSGGSFDGRLAGWKKKNTVRTGKNPLKFNVPAENPCVFVNQKASDPLPGGAIFAASMLGFRKRVGEGFPIGVTGSTFWKGRQRL